jgi:hypothetical protein
MSETESEDEILGRLEAALLRIASVAQAPRPVPEEQLNRAAFAEALDGIIARLRAELDAGAPAEPTE